MVSGAGVMIITGNMVKMASSTVSVIVLAAVGMDLWHKMGPLGGLEGYLGGLKGFL